jgi:hypothetical protein
MSLDTIHHLGAEFGHQFFSKAVEASSEAQAIHSMMRQYGVEPQTERTQVFNTFSRDSLKSVAFSVTPFSSQDLSLEGGLSVSQGGHAQGVIVYLEDRTKIVGFVHFAVANGQVVESKHSVDELRRTESMRAEGAPTFELADTRLKAIAEKVGKIKTAKPLIEITTHQVRSLASVAYNSLLGDQFSKTVHDEAEIAALRGQTDIVNEISLFVLFRTSGSACCSCSCSCWGSSSCSCSYG